MHQFLVVVDDGFSTAGLVARRTHGVDGHRICRRDRDLLLQQAPEHALFGGIKHRQANHDAEASARSENGRRSPTNPAAGGGVMCAQP